LATAALRAKSSPSDDEKARKNPRLLIAAIFFASRAAFHRVAFVSFVTPSLSERYSSAAI
jgi:hypothetical protein